MLLDSDWTDTEKFFQNEELKQRISKKEIQKYGNRVYNVLRTILIMKFETRQKMARVFRQSGRRFLRGAMKRQKKKRDCIV